MNDIGVVKRDIRCALCGQLAGIECCVPLLVFVAKAHHGDIALVDQAFGSDAIDLG